MKLNSSQLKKMQFSFSQGQQALQMQLWDVAEQHFKQILLIDPTHAPARAFLAFIFTKTKSFKLAENELRLLLKSGQNLAQTHFNLANVLYEQGLYEDAIVHYELASKLAPRIPEILINTAKCMRMLKQIDTSVALLKEALNIDKNNALALHILGLVYVDLDEQAQALECLEGACALAPNEAFYLSGFASALEKVGLTAEADIKYKRACEINPKLADTFISYGEFLYNSSQLEAALECFEHAFTLNNSDLDTVDALGKTFSAMGYLDKGLFYLNQSLQAEPNRISALYLKGRALLEHGKLAEVVDIAKQIIDHFPDDASGYELLSDAQKTIEPTLLKQLFELASDTKHVQSQLLQYTVGKIQDKIGAYKEAFNAYTSANAIAESKIVQKYSQESDLETFNKIIESFDTNLFSSMTKIGVDSSVPVVIVGMPRSGTTLTEQIISSHPSVLAAGEVPFWYQSNLAISKLTNISQAYPEHIDKLTADHAKVISHAYLALLKKIAAKNTLAQHITDKMPHNFMFLGLIALIFPNAKIIHTKRNAIDTCLSIHFQNFASGHPYKHSLDNLAFHYRQYERLMAHWHKVLPGRILDIHYEDTITDPEYWSRKLIDHVGLEWDDACLTPHKLERSVKTASVWQVRQPIYKTSVERWRNYEPYIQPLIDGLNKPIAE